MKNLWGVWFQRLWIACRGRSWPPVITLSRCAALVVVALAVTGCGGSRLHERASGMYVVEPNGAKRLIKQYPIKYAPKGLQTLVREPLPGGAYIVIIGKRYRYMGQMDSELAEHLEVPRKGRLVRGGGGSGPSMEPSEAGALTIEIGQECFGRNEIVPAYGLLHDPRDTVIAVGRGGPTVFKKTAIPVNFHPDGVLVYARLKVGPTHIVARTPSGRVVSDEFVALKPLGIPCARQ